MKKYQVSPVSDSLGGKYMDGGPVRLETDDFAAARHEFLTGQAQGRPMQLRRDDGAEWIEGPMSGRWIAPDGTEL